MKSNSDEGIKTHQSLHQNTGDVKRTQTVPDRREANQENAQETFTPDPRIRRKHSFRERGPPKLLIHFRLRSQGNGSMMPKDQA